MAEKMDKKVEPKTEVVKPAPKAPEPKGFLGRKTNLVKVGGPLKTKPFDISGLPNDMLMVQIKAQKAKGEKCTKDYLAALEAEREKRMAKK